jgi:hypothetical protein
MKRGEPHGYNNLNGVALSILVMGLLLAVVILLWIWFGHVGPSFSDQTLAQQQRALGQQYALPYKPTITDLPLLQSPPSLRNLSNGTSSNNNTSSSNSSR